MGVCRGSTVIWLTAMLLSWAIPALAEEAVIGKVLAVRGDVFATGDAGSHPLTINAPVRRGDTVVSNAGKVKIALNDGSIISVGENSRVRLAESTAGSAKTKLYLISGALRLFVARIASPGQFEVESETAIAAVRGTDWVIEAAPERSAVALLRGVVAVTGLAGKPQTTVVLDSPGFGTDIRAGVAPTPPVPWGMSRLANVLARTAFE